jgi:hypothetical protein
MTRRRVLAAVLAAGALGVSALVAVGTAGAAPPAAAAASQNVEWLAHVPTPSAVSGVAFLRYPSASNPDVMFGDGPFGLRAWSLADPAHPTLIGELPASALALPGDDVSRGFWEGEHLQVDQNRKLIFLSRDPRAFAPHTIAQEQVGTAGIDIVDAHNPRQLRLISFQPEGGGHTIQCIDSCRYIWAGGPFHSASGPFPPDWNGVPVWVTNTTNPRHPFTYPTPVDLNRNDGVTDYVHDTDVDALGIAWTSGNGGVRGYWTSGTHLDPVTGDVRQATPFDPVPYAGGKIISPNNPDDIFDHNSWHPLRPIGGFPPGDLLFVTDEDFNATCESSGHMLVVSLAGSFEGEGWRSTPQNPFRLTVVGQYSPGGQPGFVPAADNDCSAHWLEPLPGVGDGNIIVEAFYGQGTRFIDVSDPRNPVQVGYFVPDGSEAATPGVHDGLVYAAQYSTGIDVVRFTPPAG